MTKQNYTIFSVDKLIQNLGDPRVAEKLRIYRLVEEQFAVTEYFTPNLTSPFSLGGTRTAYPCKSYQRHEDFRF